MQYQNITTDAELQRYCDELAQAESIGFDTEFVAEHTFRPILCLVQVIARGRLAVNRSLSGQRSYALWEVLAGPGHDDDRTFRAGRARILLAGYRQDACRIVRRQLAAGLLGMEYPAGYATLDFPVVRRGPAEA